MYVLMWMLQAQESSEIYVHMDAVHGGSGADINELVGEIENDAVIREFIEEQQPLLFVCSL